MSKADDFLVEIGTEELPPKALRALMDAFGKNLVSLIDDARLDHAEWKTYASPRRLAVWISALALRQNERQVTQKGPPVSVAFDSDGNPTAAAVAFAMRCGVEVSMLGRHHSDKGEWLAYDDVDKGKTAADLLPGLVEQALSELPIPRRMRWGTNEATFVRPVHWIVLLHGKMAIDATLMGVTSGRHTRGHRFHSPGLIEIKSPGTYLDTLEKEGFVIADFDRRRDQVRRDVESAAASAGGHPVGGASLYDEVAALVEWPVAVVGSFDATYLDLPREAIVSTLTGHQRYFPVADAHGELLARFITVANLESTDPERIKDGNERVIRPRLADAVFFWDGDRKKTLDARQELLRDVVYQRELGNLFDKSQRNVALVKWLATHLGVGSADIERAALLAKCDLLTGMVAEFPELQGTMGRYYADADGESQTVANAIGEHYQPRFAGDELPASNAGQVLSVADKVDTLAGVFSIGKTPGGNRDPFGLRRAALGVVRILVECGLDVDLKAMIAKAVALQPESNSGGKDIAGELYVFVTDRLRRYFLDRDAGLTVDSFDAVMVRHPVSLVDFDRRLAAVQTFRHLEQAASLAAANKRIANILRKAGDPEQLRVEKKLLQDDAEKALFNALQNAREKVQPMLEVRNYAEVLSELADLRDPVDRFFDNVMVMVDDEVVMNNRLGLLSELRALFFNVADVSRLSMG